MFVCVIFYHFSWFWRNRADLPRVALKLVKRRAHQSKEHWKSWRSMSRILHLVHMGLRYGRSKRQSGGHLSPWGECFAPHGAEIWEIKGGPDYQTGGTPLGSLAVTGHLEESVSHHFTRESYYSYDGENDAHLKDAWAQMLILSWKNVSRPLI